MSNEATIIRRLASLEKKVDVMLGVNKLTEATRKEAAAAVGVTPNSLSTIINRNKQRFVGCYKISTFNGKRVYNIAKLKEVI